MQKLACKLCFKVMNLCLLAHQRQKLLPERSDICYSSALRSIISFTTTTNVCLDTSLAAHLLSTPQHKVSRGTPQRKRQAAPVIERRPRNKRATFLATKSVYPLRNDLIVQHILTRHRQHHLRTGHLSPHITHNHGADLRDMLLGRIAFSRLPRRRAARAC